MVLQNFSSHKFTAHNSKHLTVTPRRWRLGVGASAAPLPIASVPASKGAALDQFSIYRSPTPTGPFLDVIILQAGWLIICLFPAICRYFEKFFPAIPRPGKSSLPAGYVSPWGKPPQMWWVSVGPLALKILTHRQLFYFV